MSIRPIDMTGAVLRTQDMSTIKAHEDARPFAEQLTIETQRDNEERREASRVNEQENSDRNTGRFDARDKGSNEYQDNRRKDQKKESKDGSVKKMQAAPGGFDIRI